MDNLQLVHGMYYNGTLDGKGTVARWDDKMKLFHFIDQNDKKLTTSSANFLAERVCVMPDKFIAISA